MHICDLLVEVCCTLYTDPRVHVKNKVYFELKCI